MDIPTIEEIHKLMVNNELLEAAIKAKKHNQHHDVFEAYADYLGVCHFAYDYKFHFLYDFIVNYNTFNKGIK